MWYKLSTNTIYLPLPHEQEEYEHRYTLLDGSPDQVNHLAEYICVHTPHIGSILIAGEGNIFSLFLSVANGYNMVAIDLYHILVWGLWFTTTTHVLASGLVGY